MRAVHQQMLLFLVVCLGVRSGLAVTAALIDPSYLWIIGVFATLLVLGWLRIMLFAPRDSGPEVLSNGKIWWQSYRPVHAVLWTVVAGMAFASQPYTWVVMAVDTVFGLAVFLHHHARDFGLSF